MAGLDDRTIEWNLVTQRRVYRDASGRDRPVTATRMVWHGFDHLIDHYGYTPQRLLQLADAEARETRVCWDRALWNVCGYLCTQLPQRLGR